jgi:hypothetical protein
MAYGSAILRGKTLDLLKDTLNLMNISLRIQQFIGIFGCNKNSSNFNHPLCSLELKGQIKNNCSRTWEN